MKRLFELLIIAAAAQPRPLWACAVCFSGDGNEGLLKAFNWGILLLLAATFAVLGSFAYAVYRMESRRNESADEQLSA